MQSNAKNGILYSNEEETVFLLDIPASIAAAQRGSSSSSNRRDESISRQLISCAPIETPYQSTEPKSSVAKTRVSNHADDEELHQSYGRLCVDALEFLRAHRNINWTGDYCLPRVTESSNNSLKRAVGKFRSADHGPPAKAAKVDADLGSDETLPIQKHDVQASKDHVKLDRLLAELSQLSETPQRSSGSAITFSWSATPHELRSTSPDELPPSTSGDPAAPSESLVSSTVGLDLDFDPSERSPYFPDLYSNPLPTTLQLHLHPPPDTHQPSLHFHIPPKSAFLLTTLPPSPLLRASLRTFVPRPGRARGRLDLLLLDPPWPNRSATRAAAYMHAPRLSATLRLLHSLDVAAHVAPGGVVAVWTTNAPACGAAARALFDAWGVALRERWVYLKVTAAGEAVSSVDGAWRKPYEVLLVGRAAGGDKEGGGEVRSRVVVAVPDLHSRKPCLKGLFEELLLRDVMEREAGEYAAAEVFARNLVAGWLSVGNEVLKYNWEGYWSQEVEQNGVGNVEGRG